MSNKIQWEVEVNALYTDHIRESLEYIPHEYMGGSAFYRFDTIEETDAFKFWLISNGYDE